MATYHVTAEPAPGQNPPPLTCPLVPQDFMTESEEEAVGLGEQIVTEDAHHVWERNLDAANGNAYFAERATAYVAQWKVVARRVDRPAVALMPHGVADPIIRHGVVVFYRAEEDPTSFDVLIDGIASGHLLRRQEALGGKPAWHIADAIGPLAALADRRWNDYSLGHAYGTERWLEGVLADIRAALDRGGTGQVSAARR
jgi:hypothetical protein